MMTRAELDALIAILRRTPLTPAEVLWLDALLVRLAGDVPQMSQPAAPGN